MTSLSDLEKKLNKHTNEGLELLATMEIGAYERYIKNQNISAPENKASIEQIILVKKIIENNLSNAITSPNAYIREWGKFCSKLLQQ